MTVSKHSSIKKGKASILKEPDVIRLRELAASGLLNTAEAARAHGVGVETIRRAVRGDTFSNLNSAPIDEEQLSQDAAASAARMQEMIAGFKAKQAVGPAIVKELAAAETTVQQMADAFGAKSIPVVNELVEGEHDAGYD